MTVAALEARERSQAGWRAAAALLLVAVGIGLLYRDAVAAAWRVWLGSTAYNHCLLILPLAGFMAWSRRQRLDGVGPQVSWPTLAALVPVLTIWLCARLFNLLEAQQFALLTMFQIAAMVLLGWPIYRRILAAFLFLYLLVPTGAFLVLPLQNFTARFVVLCLQLSGVPVFADGTVIQVPSGTFVVAEACAGLRFLIAAIAFGIFYACEVYASIRRRLVFIGLCFVIPVFANGLRGFGLIMASEFFGSASAVEADHVLYGWLFFSMVLFVLIYVGRLFADRPAFAPYPPVAGPQSERQSGLTEIGLAAGACLLLAAIGPLVQAGLGIRAIVSLPSEPPPVPAGWHRVTPASDWQPKLRRGDRVFADAIEKDGRRLDRFVALYLPHGVPANPASGEDRLADPEVWRPVRAGFQHVVVGGWPFSVQTLEAVASGNRRRTIWAFYDAGGQPTASGWTARWLAFRSYLAASPCPAAFVAVSTLGSQTDGLRQYLQSADLSRSYICSQ